MAVLLMRLAGPMQSWGIQSRFSIRDTGMEPSKSGVIGLICAALGRPRSESVDDLAALKMGVRVNHEGAMKSDYHTAQNVLKAGGGTKDCELSTRYYLADADFLVGLESHDVSLLKQIHAALQNPCWQIFLGRKAFVPSHPVYIQEGILDTADTLTALRDFPWEGRTQSIASEDNELGEKRLRFVIETPFGQGDEVRPDQPVGAAFQTREFNLRYVRTTFEPVKIRKEAACTSQG